MYSERKGVKDDSKIFGLSYYRAGAAINLAGEICVEEILRGKIDQSDSKTPIFYAPSQMRKSQ